MSQGDAVSRATAAGTCPHGSCLYPCTAAGVAAVLRHSNMIPKSQVQTLVLPQNMFTHQSLQLTRGLMAQLTMNAPSRACLGTSSQPVQQQLQAAATTSCHETPWQDCQQRYLTADVHVGLLQENPHPALFLPSMGDNTGCPVLGGGWRLPLGQGKISQANISQAQPG